MDAESAVRIRFGLPFRVKFIRGKGFGILDDFLSVDSGQPLFGWFSLQANFTKKGLHFLYHMSDFWLQPWPEIIAITTLLEFRSWLGGYFQGR